MSNIKISEMPSATSVGGSDLIPIVQSGVSKQTSLTTINTPVDITSKLTFTPESRCYSRLFWSNTMWLYFNT